MPLSDNQRRLRRSKQVERDTGKWMQLNDGIDEQWAKIATSTSRVGHINDLQFDVISTHYCVETKNIKMTAKLLGFWQKIQDVASKHGKHPCLIIQPSNPPPGTRIQQWHILTALRHQELLEKERAADAGKLAIRPRPSKQSRTTSIGPNL